MSASIYPLALCLLSAVTVAATNMFVKRGGDVLSTRMVVSIVMGLTVLPFAFVVPFPNATLWGALAMSVVIHWFYQFAMIRALHRGDLSLVFPVMRGLAPLLTAIMAVFVLNEAPSLTGWAGLILASLALIVFALPESAAPASKLKNEALIWAALTAIGIAGYSVIDARGVRLAENLFTFVVWLFMLDWIGITTALIVTQRDGLWERVRPQIRDGAIGGVLGTISYGAALWAFTMSEAATVTAMRETSVVFGALFGAIFLRESFGRRRVAAACVLATGLLMLELGT